MSKMTARGERYVPVVKMARMKVVERDAPVFGYSRGNGTEDWTVARGA
jgi:D-alanyl-D-alanine carboxypeptidase/D-alanyl-D-alanine-endopeptidase (penicillin-binding protein 4)